MQPEKSYLAIGTLVDQQRVIHEIEIVILTRPLPDRGEAEDEAISGIKLAQRSPVPDGGPYVLRYVFKGRQYEHQVRVEVGKLISS